MYHVVSCSRYNIVVGLVVIIGAVVDFCYAFGVEDVLTQQQLRNIFR